MENYSYGSSPFWYSSAIKVIIEDGVTSIGNYAFCYCYNLTSITIPDTVTSMGECTFECCTSLTSITIPNSVTSIGESAFKNCLDLTSITIPDSVTSIGYEAFYSCYNLESITIPASVTNISYGAFGWCSNLRSITIQNPDCQIYDEKYTISNGYDYLTDEFYFDGTIYGYKDSTAQAYAENYGYTFKSLDETVAILGDVDGNGIVDGRDASMVLTHYALTSTSREGVITDVQALLNADWDQNEIVDGRDASAILTYYAEQSVNKS